VGRNRKANEFKGKGHSENARRQGKNVTRNNSKESRNRHKAAKDGTKRMMGVFLCSRYNVLDEVRSPAL